MGGTSNLLNIYHVSNCILNTFTFIISCNLHRNIAELKLYIPTLQREQKVEYSALVYTEQV